MTNSTLNNNTANLGGAICNRYGKVTLTSNIFNNTTANLTGGAIMNFGNLTVTNNTFTGNTAQNGGGAICNGDGNITLTDNTFTGNTAQNGGGAIYIAGGDLTVTNNTFNNNTARGGGAIWNYGTLNVTTSKFNNNTSENGGAIWNYGTLNVTTSKFNNNIATDTTTIYGSGGAIWNYDGDPTSRVINFNWIVGNSPNNSEIYSTNGTLDATLNWWGSNVDPSGFVAGNVTVTPWLVLNVTVDPITILNGGNSTVTVDLQHDSNGTYHDPNEGHVPDGIPVTFTGTLGNLNQPSTTLLNGQATSLFTAKSAVTAKASITATIDNYSASTPITLNSRSPPTVTVVDPANGAVNVAINKVIRVTFNESIIKGTGWIELVTSNGSVVPSTWSISGNVLTVNVNSTLT
ncbi:MAG: Ig-like domain-containing protein, partial [Methanobacterium paludis]|nr:Ig-like domain-containing protein [Methanobacterium paludis]